MKRSTERRRDRHRSIFTFVVPEGLAADLSSALLSSPSTLQREMAAAKTEMLLPALQISDHLSFPHSPMDNYPKLEEMIMLNSAGTPFLNATAPEGTGFGSGEPGDHFDHLAGGKH